MKALEFPPGFLWGAATSSHQVEGSQDNDWTEWESRGKIRDGTVSGQACDHWNRYEEDFDIARTLGHNAHRLSLEWSRIEPRQGEWNESALEHYRSVIRALRQRGMEPFVTLWHFSNPKWFARQDGWGSLKAPVLFGQYAHQVVQALPEVKFWLTVNEPNVYALMSYLVGLWPPGVKSWVRAWQVYQHLAKSHVQAYQVMKEVAPKVMVGSAPNLVFFEPRQPNSFADRLVTRIADRWYQRRWLELTNGSSDFIGVNHYVRQVISFHSLLKPIVQEAQGQPQTDMGWQIYPEAIYQVLRMAQAYHKPIYVTENGIADATDKLRQGFVADYLAQVHRAIQEGVDVRGYFYWSLLDNFEWHEGFAKRFGLVAVDFTTQQRTIRPSAQWLAGVCKTNTLYLNDA